MRGVSVYCTHCGHSNPDDARFCSNCGRPLASPSDTTTGLLRIDDAREGQEERPGDELRAIAADLAPGTALLVAVRGANRGERFLLDREVTTAGRHPDSDIFLDDITVSRRHAEFVRVDGRLHVRDSGSLNGTYVNGKLAEDLVLTDGDEVQIGKFKLVAYVAEPATS